jgi:uncharacterized membrane protein (GlpM family)
MSIYMVNKERHLEGSLKNPIAIITWAIIPSFFYQIYISSYFMASNGL